MTARPPRQPGPMDPIPDETASERPTEPPGHHPFAGHLRASLVLLALTILLLGWLFYREPFGWKEAAAMTVIFAAVAAVKRSAA